MALTKLITFGENVEVKIHYDTMTTDIDGNLTMVFYPENTDFHFITKKGETVELILRGGPSRQIRLRFKVL